jgi:hypothetical protein
MTKEKVEEYSVEQLRNRKKMLTWMLYLFSAIILILMFYVFIITKRNMLNFSITLLPMLIVELLFFVWLKRTNEEIEKRENS